MIFWNKTEEYWDVFPDWTEEKITAKADEYGIGLAPDSLENRWCIFGQVIARENGLDDITAASMGYVTSMFFGGMGVSSGTDMYFDEEKIDYSILDFINGLSDCEDELIKMRKTFDFILGLYMNDLEKYEYRHIRWELRISQSELNRLKDVPGKTRADKFRVLLDHWDES